MGKYYQKSKSVKSYSNLQGRWPIVHRFGIYNIFSGENKTLKKLAKNKKIENLTNMQRSAKTPIKSQQKVLFKMLNRLVSESVNPLKEY